MTMVTSSMTVGDWPPMVYVPEDPEAALFGDLTVADLMRWDMGAPLDEATRDLLCCGSESGRVWHICYIDGHETPKAMKTLAYWKIGYYIPLLTVPVRVVGGVDIGYRPVLNGYAFCWLSTMELIRVRDLQRQCVLPFVKGWIPVVGGVQTILRRELAQLALALSAGALRLPVALSEGMIVRVVGHPSLDGIMGRVDKLWASSERWAMLVPFDEGMRCVDSYVESFVHTRPVQNKATQPTVGGWYSIEIERKYLEPVEISRQR